MKIFALLALGIFLHFNAWAADKTNAPPLLTPGLNDGRIAYLTARFLELYHYSQRPLDKEMSEKFFDGYLDALDPQHLYFLKSDVAEFSHYRTNLDTLTINNRGIADLTPAYQIFERFLERLRPQPSGSVPAMSSAQETGNRSDRYLRGSSGPACSREVVQTLVQDLDLGGLATRNTH